METNITGIIASILKKKSYFNDRKEQCRNNSLNVRKEEYFNVGEEKYFNVGREEYFNA